MVDGLREGAKFHFSLSLPKGDFEMTQDVSIPTYELVYAYTVLYVIILVQYRPTVLIGYPMFL